MTIKRLHVICSHIYPADADQQSLRLEQHPVFFRNVVETVWSAFVGRAGEMVFESGIDIALPNGHRPNRTNYPFISLPPSLLGHSADAFEQLACTDAQQADLRRVAARVSHAWDSSSNHLPTQPPNKPVLVILQGPPGSGKTTHAREFARYLGATLVVLGPANASNTDRFARTPFVQALQFANRQLPIAVILVEELDMMLRHHETAVSEFRQAVDGAITLSESRRVVIVATACMPPSEFPVSLKTRAFRIVRFRYFDNDDQLAAFWEKRAGKMSLKHQYPVTRSLSVDGVQNRKTQSPELMNSTQGDHFVIPHRNGKMKEYRWVALCEVHQRDALTGDIRLQFLCDAFVLKFSKFEAEVAVNTDMSRDRIIPLIEASRGLSQRELVRSCIDAHVQWASTDICLASKSWSNAASQGLAPSLDCFLQHVRGAHEFAVDDA